MKKRIEVIEPNGFMDGAVKRECGDILSTDQGQYFIDLGWAKCCETGECGDRIEGISKIQPNNVIQKTAL